MFRDATTKMIIPPIAVSILLSVVLCALGGCGAGGGGGGGILNQLDRLPDTDGDGFPEIEPPPGVEFDPTTALAYKINNTITRSQAEAASGVNMPDAVSSRVSVSMNAAVTLIYPDGTEQVLRGTFPLGALELGFEVACPDSIEVLVTAMADTPVTSPQAVKTFGPFTRAMDDESESYCGGIITLGTSADENGELVAEVVVE